MEELILDKIKKSNENNKIEFNNIINKKLNIENKKDIKENKNNILYFIFFYIILLFSIIIYYNSNQKKELERLEKELKSTYIKLQEVYLDLDIISMEKIRKQRIILIIIKKREYLKIFK